MEALRSSRRGFHNLHLPGGRRTAPDHPLGDFPAYRWREIAPRQARWAAGELGLLERIESREAGAYDVGTLAEEPVNVVLLLGVLYHLRHLLLAMQIVAGVTGRVMVVQTLTLPGEARIDPPANLSIDERDRLLRPGWPTMAFIEHELAGDLTNGWAPTRPAWRRCCAPVACGSTRIRGTRSGCAGARSVSPAVLTSWHEDVVPAAETAGMSLVAMKPRDDSTTPAGMTSPPITMLGDPGAAAARSDATKRRAMHAAMAAAVRALRSSDGRAGWRSPPGGVL